ncbi:hypothetical protein [Promicromonospora umidemergens]|uniref:hypothetical protein n=1 Tax=Promicromonospora umidemergens TaxID=629679 RepID=UPI0031E55A6C
MPECGVQDEVRDGALEAVSFVVDLVPFEQKGCGGIRDHASCDAEEQTTNHPGPAVDSRTASGPREQSAHHSRSHAFRACGGAGEVARLGRSRTFVQGQHVMCPDIDGQRLHRGKAGEGGSVYVFNLCGIGGPHQVVVAGGRRTFGRT